MKKPVALLSLTALCLVLLASTALAETYVLEAGTWGAAQTRTVERAGGKIVWRHSPTGIGVVRSENPRFLERVRASGRFRLVEKDVMVEWVQPPVVQRSVDPVDDRHYPKQWNLEAIKAPQAWDAGCTGAGARVAVIDGGINDNHLDLVGQVDVACSTSFVPGEPFNSDVGGLWHGSHVAGIVAAADNDFGVVGVAPDATLMAVKVLHDGTGPFSSIIGGILFASDPAAFGTGCTQRADIINMSLAVIFFQRQAPGFHSLVAKAVNFAASSGVLVISAASNEGLDLGQLFDMIVIPAQSGSGLAVSATGPIGWQAAGNTDFTRIASYSNYGEDLVDIAGPGGDFVYPGDESCTFDGTTFPCWVFDLIPAPCGGSGGNFTCWTAGTSMASPAVAGVAALIKGRYPSISLGRLKTRLLRATDDEGKRGHDEFYGSGFVNAYKACTQ
ncbi:MAG: S8 family serine peptidase [Acidobacteriota bacterium]|nr:S8 family serine peptidase [Acidobacteriota bacterium]